MRRTARRVAAGWMAAAAAAGCTRYEVAPPGAAAEGARVRVTLTEAGTAALARSTAGAGVVAVEGIVESGGGDTLRLRADRLLTSAGVPVTWNGGEVAVSRADVRTLDRRVADRARTAWLVAGGVAAGAAFLAVVRNAGSAGRGGGSGGPTPF